MQHQVALVRAPSRRSLACSHGARARCSGTRKLERGRDWKIARQEFRTESPSGGAIDVTTLFVVVLPAAGVAADAVVTVTASLPEKEKERAVSQRLSVRMLSDAASTTSSKSRRRGAGSAIGSNGAPTSDRESSSSSTPSTKRSTGSDVKRSGGSGGGGSSQRAGSSKRSNMLARGRKLLADTHALANVASLSDLAAMVVAAHAPPSSGATASASPAVVDALTDAIVDRLAAIEARRVGAVPAYAACFFMVCARA
jgi:hypothetical protein